MIILGKLLHENWELKKVTCVKEFLRPKFQIGTMLHGLRVLKVEKVLGAGAGGFMIFYAKADRHSAIEKAVEGLKRVKFGFEPLGSRESSFTSLTHKSRIELLMDSVRSITCYVAVRNTRACY